MATKRQLRKWLDECRAKKATLEHEKASLTTSYNAASAHVTLLEAQLAECKETTPNPPSPTPARAWEWDARTQPRDPDSARYMEKWRTYAIVRPNLAMRAWAVAVVEAKTDSPVYNVPVKAGRSHALDPKLRIPLGTRPDPSGDGHLVIVDTLTEREHDLFEAEYDEASGRIIRCGGGASMDIGAVNEGKQCWGGSAAQTPLLRGLVNPDRIEGRQRMQTLQFANPCIGGVPRVGRYPAINNAPTYATRCGQTDGTWNIPEGSWLALPPDYPDRADLPHWQRVICNTLRDKGMILRDNGGALTIYGRNDINDSKKWESVGLSGNSAPFSSTFPWRELELLTPPEAA